MDARIAFHRPRADGPGTYPHHARLGLAYLERAQLTGSERDLARAERHLLVSLDQQRNVEALVGLAKLESHRHRFDSARSFAEEALAAAPDGLEARGVLVEVALARNDVGTATRQVERMLATGPSFEGFAHEAALHEHEGRDREALAAMERACQAAEDAGRPAGASAWCAARRGDLLLKAWCDAAGAEETYREALAIEPRLALARRGLAELRARERDPDDPCRLAR